MKLSGLYFQCCYGGKKKKREKKQEKKIQTPSFLKTFVNRQTGRGHSCIFTAAKPNKTDNCCILTRETPLANAGPSSEPLQSVATATARGPGALVCRFALPQFSPLQTQRGKRGSPAGLVWECFSPRGSVEYRLPRCEGAAGRQWVKTPLRASTPKKLFVLRNTFNWPPPPDMLAAPNEKDPNAAATLNVNNNAKMT